MIRHYDFMFIDFEALRGKDFIAYSSDRLNMYFLVYSRILLLSGDVAWVKSSISDRKKGIS